MPFGVAAEMVLKRRGCVALLSTFFVLTRRLVRIARITAEAFVPKPSPALCNADWFKGYISIIPESLGWALKSRRCRSCSTSRTWAAHESGGACGLHRRWSGSLTGRPSEVYTAETFAA